MEDARRWRLASEEELIADRRADSGTQPRTASCGTPRRNSGKALNCPLASVATLQCSSRPTGRFDGVDALAPRLHRAFGGASPQTGHQPDDEDGLTRGIRRCGLLLELLKVGFPAHATRLYAAGRHLTGWMGPMAEGQRLRWQRPHQNMLRPATIFVRTLLPHTRQGSPWRR